MSFSPEAFGVRLRQAREDVGLTQSEVADRLPELQISKAHLSHWEKGRHAPAYNALTLLAGLYKVSETYLLTGSEDNEKMLSEEQYEIARRAMELPEHLRAFVLLALEIAEKGQEGLPASISADPTLDNFLDFAAALHRLSRK